MTSKQVDPEDHDSYIAIWSKAVDTQMHFNEMSVKSRQLGLTFVVAVLGVAVVLLSRGSDFSIAFVVHGCAIQLHVSVMLFLCAFMALEAVKQLDLNVYHKMLRGAVAFGEDFEATYMKRIFELEKGMTQSISHFSRYENASTEISASGSHRYIGSRPVSAETKIRKFYRAAQGFTALVAIVLFFVTNSSNWETVSDMDSSAGPPSAIENVSRP